MFMQFCFYCYTLEHHHLPLDLAQSVECPLRGTGGHGFDPGPRHTKVVKNGTCSTSIGTRTCGQANVTGCGIMSSVLGLDTSVRQHYKSEH